MSACVVRSLNIHADLTHFITISLFPTPALLDEEQEIRPLKYIVPYHSLSK